MWRKLGLALVVVGLAGLIAWPHAGVENIPGSWYMESRLWWVAVAWSADVRGVVYVDPGSPPQRSHGRYVAYVGFGSATTPW